MTSKQFIRDPFFTGELPNGPSLDKYGPGVAKLLMFGDFVRAALRRSAGNVNETDVVAEESGRFPYRMKSVPMVK